MNCTVSVSVRKMGAHPEVSHLPPAKAKVSTRLLGICAGCLSRCFLCGGRQAYEMFFGEKAMSVEDISASRSVCLSWLYLLWLLC